jgi:hypothetical protein
MKFVELKEPRYKDMSVLIGKYRLTDEKSILWFSKAKFLKDKRFIIFRNEINNFETEFINNFECIKISLKQLKNISTAEIIRAKYVDSLFYKK